MSIIDVTFGDNPVAQLLSALKPGGDLSASRLLTALDGESESVLEDTFEILRDMQITPDVTDLPRYTADSETALRLRREEQFSAQEDLIGQLSENDPLRMYLEELAGIPAFGEIGALTQQLKAANAVEDMDAPVLGQVLNLFLHRVVEIARSYTGKGVLLMDLIQEGSMGLWERLPYYEEGDLTVFAEFWIRWYMVKAIVCQAYAAGTGSKLRQAMEDYRTVDEKLLAELGRNPTIQEIAEGLHMSVQETTVVAQMLENARMLSRAKKPEPEQIPQEEDQAVEDTAYFQMRQRIAELLSSLEEEDVKLLTLRYGLEGGLPMNPQQVGQQMGLTPEEVIKRESAALAMLRQQK